LHLACVSGSSDNVKNLLLLADRDDLQQGPDLLLFAAYTTKPDIFRILWIADKVPKSRVLKEINNLRIHGCPKAILKIICEL
jgi:hypothetical protein